MRPSDEGIAMGLWPHATLALHLQVVELGHVLVVTYGLLGRTLQAKNRKSFRLSQSQSIAVRIATTIEDRVNVNSVIVGQIVDRERKPRCAHAMESVRNFMDSRVQNERPHVGLNTIEKVVA